MFKSKVKMKFLCDAEGCKKVVGLMGMCF